jgi:D-inositol-3-phosphate glycosyltransferase
LLTYVPQFVAGIEEFSLTKGVTYDLIHSHYWLSGLAANTLKEHWGIPVIQMFHTLGRMKQRVARSIDESEGEYRLTGEQAVMAQVDRIVAATPAELAQLQWLYQIDPKKIVVIPPGVDLSHFYPIPADEAKEFIGVPPCERTLLFVGRIEPLKGIDTLIEAIVLLRDQGEFERHPFCLAVIGGEPEISQDGMSNEMLRLQELRAKYNLKNLVTFLGKRDQDTLPYYYSAAEAVVVPSQYESFGMVALEAMACGTPVVASQIGGLAFLVQDGVTGYTVPTSDPRALAERVVSLIKDPELRDRMGKQAAEFAKDYGWQIIADRILTLYTQTVRM